MTTVNVPQTPADVPARGLMVDLDPAPRDRRPARRRPGVRPLYDVHYSDARRKVKRPQNWTTDPTTGKSKPKTRRRYEVRWIDNDGRQRSERFEDKRDAIARHAALTAEFETGSYIPRERSQTLVSEVARTYVSTVVASKPPTTRQSYESIIDRFVGRFGQRTVGSLVPTDISGWVTAMSADGRSLTTRRKYVAVVSKMLDSAVGDGLIPKNPAKGVDLGRNRAQSGTTRSIGADEVPTREHIDTVLSKIGSADVRDMLRFMSYSGLRVGEAAELRVRDVFRVDEDGNRVKTIRPSTPDEGTDDGALAMALTVSRAVTEPRGKLVVGPPKSGKPRVVDLGTSATMILLERLRGAHAVVNPDDPNALVFPSATGEQHRGSNVNRALRSACEGAKVRRFTTHAMRHHFATTALARPGVTLTDVSQWLGHADVSITARVYAHAVRANQRAAARLLP